MACLFRPLTTSEIGNGQQQVPVVSELVRAGRLRRRDGLQPLAVFARPTQSPLPQFGKPSIVNATEMFDKLAALLRFISMMIERLSVVSGSFRPFIPIAFGVNTGKACGVLSSPTQRGTQAPRVHPEFMTARSGSLFIRITSASSTMMLGCQISIERNSVASLISIHYKARGTRKLMMLRSCVLPLLGSADVTSKIGECTAATSCTQANKIHNATVSAMSSLRITCCLMRVTKEKISSVVLTGSAMAYSSMPEERWWSGFIARLRDARRRRRPMYLGGYPIYPPPRCDAGRIPERLA